MKISKNGGLNEREVASSIADTSFLPTLEQAAFLDDLLGFEDARDDISGLL